MYLSCATNAQHGGQCSWQIFWALQWIGQLSGHPAANWIACRVSLCGFDGNNVRAWPILQLQCLHSTVCTSANVTTSPCWKNRTLAPQRRVVTIMTTTAWLLFYICQTPTTQKSSHSCGGHYIEVERCKYWTSAMNQTTSLLIIRVKCVSQNVL